ncbi:MAG: tetratricopeptide repeat protein [Rhodoferax sp.]|nr:tetratricopeptide repeat protein [Rhodoferax sp.]
MHKSTPTRPAATDLQFAALNGGNLLTQLTQKANHLLKQGALQAAEHSYLEVLELEPGNIYALVGLARAARLRGDLAGAEQFYQQSLAKAPYNRFAMIGLADCYLADGHLSKALALWKKCLSLDDKDLAVLTRMADAYRKAKRFEPARQMYDRALALDAHHVYALIGLGYVYYATKDYQNALICWNAAHTAQPARSDLRLLTNLGNCYRKLNQFEAAIAYFEQALALEDGNFYALFGLADSYRGLHQLDQSLIHWDAILTRQPANKIVLTRAADALRQLGRLDQAQARYQQALDIEFDFFALLGLALVAKLQGRYGPALRLLTQVQEQEPDNLRVQRLIAECQRQAAGAGNGR